MPPHPALVPQPRRLEWGDASLPAGRLVFAEVPDALAAFRPHLERLLAAVGTGGEPEVAVALTRATTESEGYELDVNADGVRVRAGDPHGALHAVRTLVDLWDGGDGDGLPHVRIADHPTYRRRGLFAESFAGSDRMDATDWRTFIDRAGQLKLNTVGVSVYGCWDLRHDTSRSEYLFVPLDDFPQLRTPQRMVTWDVRTGREVTQVYLPTFFADDLFAEVVRYAAEQGIEVIPHFGGPGHSTLLPRLVPDLSALDDDGAPTGYGYCVSRPAARAALLAVVANLVRQHLVPAGVRRLHVAADEYYPIRNIDPDDRLRTVSPYCRCDGCRDLSPGEQLIEYLMAIGGLLAEHDIGMVHWHDTLVREGVLDTYLDRAAAAGFRQPVITWWKYNDPVPVPDARTATTWVAPTTGLFATLFSQDFGPNIETMLRRGRQAGAEGVLAYTMPSPADHANVACLADLAWNLEGSGGATGFRTRWARLLSPADPDAAAHALSLAGTVTASYPLMMYLLQHVLPYFATSAAGVTTYPDDIVRAAALTQPPLADVLRQSRATVLDAVASMPAGRPVRYWGDPAGTWSHQLLRLAGSLGLLLDLLAAARDPGDGPDAAGELTARGVDLMRATAAGAPAYLVPATLREHWGLVREIGPALERLRDSGAVTAPENWHAWII
ncbi:glycoside hydrolase family 20 zincin-like fold domain-containing protein [Jiangella gansuensis]|uniref:glycoside hydrolase family 20 zincin-like fold domain-containing protein n=1 Tax=Jiangella gansuensis TaxID=281473 RepID=UPI000479D984|nr:glycoside hydrolase family 20 zincin-like fold domain-containing protein [Jiangella gansuensis]